MKTFYLSGIAILVCLQLSAQVLQGPFTPGTAAAAPLAGSNLSWKVTDNVLVRDDVYSYFDISAGSPGDHTDFLIASNFGFNIPTSSTINGITVTVERSDPNLVTTDYSIRIVKGGSVGSTEYSTEFAYPATDDVISYGSNSDLWGETWTAADINSSDFGVAIAAQILAGGAGNGGQIDVVTISVSYSLITLPVRLTAFSGSAKNDLVHLVWTTTDESQMNHFEVQRSTNGADFNSIGSVNCTNRSFLTSYAFDDVNPVNGISSYRLKMVGTSGEINYSKIISIKYGAESGKSIYPSLWSPGTPLSINNGGNEKLRIEFFNNSGQITGVVTTSSGTVPTEALAKQTGMLYYKIIGEDGQLQGTGRLQVR